MRTFIYLSMLSLGLNAQHHFPYTVHVEPINISDLPGLHSYAVAQYDDKWLFIGGRTDGLHARQPFNAFPETLNNTDIYVVDPQADSVWSSNLNVLPTSIREQLQTTNMNFYQDGDTLYYLGGYAYSASANNHITFPNLTSIQVSGLVNAIINGDPISPFFKQITNQNFAITGGQMGKIGNTFIVVGGHRFDGRYNPMGNPTYTQAYTNQVRRFNINNSGSQLSISNYTTNTDPVHLRRRDYNLLPQKLPGGDFGYTISAGVFQPQADLPFLYPVDINDSGYVPHTNFNQYLSHYHGAKVAMYDSAEGVNHALFFGGISQYYPDANGQLIQDNAVPFVRTISLLSRFPDGRFEEYALPDKMPELQGASSEFIFNKDLPHHWSKIVLLNDIQTDTIVLGHVFGGIHAVSRNPFSQNQTNTTSADNTLFKVYLVKDQTSSVQKIHGAHEFSVNVYPNPANDYVDITAKIPDQAKAHYFITDLQGRMIVEGNQRLRPDETLRIDLPGHLASQRLILNVVFNDRYYTTHKLDVVR